MAGFKSGKREGSSAITALSLTHSLALKTIFCKVKIGSFPHRVHHL